GQAVSRHVGQVDSLFTVGKYVARTVSLVERHGRALSGCETFFGLRWVPNEDFVLGDQCIGMAVTGEVDEAQVGVTPVDVGQVGKRNEALPTVLLVTFVEARHRWMELHQIEYAIALHVDQVLAPGVQRRHRGLWRNRPRGAELRSERAASATGLVVPRA